LQSIEPCPFCGTHNLKILELDCDAWSIECLDCQAIGPIKTSAEEAIAAWARAHEVLREPA
jgi:Lar family restriction alleviation protein